ncbi:MAG: hypothetical protein KBC38_03495 [Candidatus Pacebacteria bacterium]|nr:hypothetical protein [Candidatus Paceibacterota bacterium]MBP9840759.1 hypothetical protein [Candidatus Paceibacterota bacterium]
MGVIVPAIIPTSKHDLEEKLRRLSGVTDFVQIDVVDGKFAGPASWPYGGHESELSSMENLPQWGEFKFDIDLMVEHPDQVSGLWIDQGASRVTIHAESTRYLAKTMEELESRYGHDQGFAPELLSFGLAVGTTTDISLIEPYLHFVEYVQFMGIRRIGKQGEPFDVSVVDRIRALRKKHPELTVQVDGGVNRATAPALLEAGVDRLIVGSALWLAPDLKAEYDFLMSLTEQYGLYE